MSHHYTILATSMKMRKMVQRATRTLEIRLEAIVSLVVFAGNTLSGAESVNMSGIQPWTAGHPIDHSLKILGPYLVGSSSSHEVEAPLAA